MRNDPRAKGIATPLVLAIILALAALAGAAYFASQQRDDSTPADDTGQAQQKSPGGSENVIDKEEIGSGDTSAAPSDPQGSFVATGEVLAGSTTPFVDFNQSDYDRALRENRFIVLYFYANWCPICRVELTRLKPAFDELELPNVVGFQVSYNDNQTDDFEENLARQFGIAYQHTKIFLKGGQQVLKNGETWSKARYIEEITKAAQ